MSGIFLGGDAIEAVKVGSEDAVAVYVGSEQVWPSSRTYDEEVMADSPLGYWPMQEPSGTTLTDVSGNGLNGTYSSVTLGSTGPGSTLTSAAEFNGTSSSGSIGINLSSLGSSNVEITIEFWLRVTSWTTATSRIIMEYTANHNNASGGAISRHTSAGPINVTTSSSGLYRARSFELPPTSQWCHWSAVWSRVGGGTPELVDLMIDGVRQEGTIRNSNNISGAFANSTLYLMSRGGSSLYMAGQMAGLACFGTRLLDSRRRAHAATILGPVAPPPVEITGTFGSLSGSSKWAFGGLAPNGKIYANPYQASTMLVIDPANQTASEVSASGRVVGTILAGDGKLYSPPEASGGGCLVIDPEADTSAAFGPAPPISGGDRTWYDGAAAPNGCVYCPPTRSGNFVLKIDPDNGPSPIGSNLGTSQDGREWGGAVAVGDIIYMPPRHGGTCLRVDTTNDTVTEIGSSLGGTRSYSGGVLADNGLVYFVPKNETRVLVLDPDDESFDHITGLPSGTDKWASAIARNGRVFFFPRQYGAVLVVDTSDHSWELVPFSGVDGSGDRLIGAVEGADGFVYSIPANSTRVIKWRLH